MFDVLQHSDIIIYVFEFWECIKSMRMVNDVEVFIHWISLKNVDSLTCKHGFPNIFRSNEQRNEINFFFIGPFCWS